MKVRQGQRHQPKQRDSNHKNTSNTLKKQLHVNVLVACLRIFTIYNGFYLPYNLYKWVEEPLNNLINPGIFHCSHVLSCVTNLDCGNSGSISIWKIIFKNANCVLVPIEFQSDHPLNQ